MERILIIIFALPFLVFSEFFSYEFGTSQQSSNPVNTIVYQTGKKKECSECHTSIYDKKLMHAAAEDDCTNCHESIESKHPKKGKKGFKLVDNVPSLCFTCHEENAVKKHVHDPSGEGECMMCHDPHSSKKPGLLIKSNAGKLCAECHEMEMHQKEYRHRPVQKGNCQSCHDPHQSDNAALLKDRAPKLCFSCHEDKKEAMNLENIHAPFDDDCSMCHVVHSSENKHLTTLPMPSLCYECHDDIQTSIEKAKFVHKAVNEKSGCASCHDPHASNNGKFLIAEGAELCVKCHNKEIKGDGYIIQNIKRNIKKEYLHAPVDDGCSTCHEHHASENDILLIDAFPAGKYAPAKPESFSLCFNCHEAELLTEKETKYATEFRHGKQNLHALHIQGEKGRNCTNCHNVHGAENPHLIENKVYFGEWEMPIRYKVSDNGGSCAPACHALEEYDRTAKPKVELIAETVVEKEKQPVDTKSKEEISKVEEEPNIAVVTSLIVEEKKEEIAEKKDTLVVEENTIAENKTEEITNEEEQPVDTKSKEEISKVEGDLNVAVIIPPIITEKEDSIAENKDSVIIDNKIIVENKTEEITNEEEQAIDTKPKEEVRKGEEELTIAVIIPPIVAEKEEEVVENKDSVIVDNNIVAENKTEEAKVVSVITVEESVEEENEKMAVAESTKVVSVIDEYNQLTKLEIKFEFDKVSVIPGTDKGLDEIILFMKKYPDIRFEIQGHTDSIGDASYNVYLSEQRAKSVQKKLIERGINRARIPVKGYGETMPISSNATIKSRAKNRRVEIKALNLK